jgi:hypothetical protein
MTDKLPNLSPHRVRTPIALIAIGLVLMTALVISGHQWWAALVALLVAASIGVLIWRPELRLQEWALLEYLNRQFRGRTADASEEPREPGAAAEDPLSTDRLSEITRNRGLFLVHTWKFSEKQGQVADIIIRLHQHLDTSTRQNLLAEGVVESVEYELGRRFFKEPVIKRNPEDGFALEVSAYRPMLCLAEVTFNDDHPPLRLSRYIDFPTDA